MNKVLRDRLIELLKTFPDNFDSASLNWIDDDTRYNLSLSVSGGSFTITGSAYKPDPVPEPQVTERLRV